MPHTRGPQAVKLALPFLNGRNKYQTTVSTRPTRLAQTALPQSTFACKYPHTRPEQAFRALSEAVSMSTSPHVETVRSFDAEGTETSVSSPGQSQGTAATAGAAATATNTLPPDSAPVDDSVAEPGPPPAAGGAPQPQQQQHHSSPLLTNQMRKKKEPSTCMQFLFAACCVDRPEPQLGYGRRICGTDAIVGPYFWGGWVVIFVNMVALGMHTAFTPAHEHWWLLVLQYTLFVATLVCQLRAQCTEPGIIPRGGECQSFPKSSPNVVDSHVGNTVNGLLIKNEDCVFVEGESLVVWRWCHTCEVHRPPRSAHCPHCNWCVKEYDHHCPVMGTCVGQRTMRWFMLALLLLAAQALVMFITCVYYTVTHDYDSAVGSFRGVVGMLTLVGCILVGMCGGTWAALMGGQYVFFACVDLTMRENVRGFADGVQKRESSPNGCSSLAKKVCGPQAPTLIKNPGRAYDAC